jgi:hypothetical protein
MMLLLLLLLLLGGGGTLPASFSNLRLGIGFDLIVIVGIVVGMLLLRLFGPRNKNII